MNTDAYSLSDAYVTVGAGPMESVDTFARQWVAGHYMIAFAIILVLVLVIVGFMLFHTCKEKFSPTSTMRMQSREDRERLDPGADRTQSVFAQQVQSSGLPTLVADPNAAANAPGSLNYQVLHSDDFNCDKRQPAGDDAWSWMAGVAKENFTPKTENDFTRLLAGH